MGNNVTELKKLAVKLGCASSVSNVTGETISEVISFIEKKYPIPSLPTADGNYKLVIASGVASWVAI